ncbi:multicopy suppressor of BFA (Brefeldin A) [Lecanora helva]
MADLATPSAVTMSTIDAGSEQQTKPQRSRPEKPDEEQYKEILEKAEKEHKAAQEKLNAVKAKLDLAQPSNRDSAASKRQQELRTELKSIREQQSGFKSSRGNIQDKIASLDTRLKSQTAEYKTRRNQVSWKNPQEIDREIQRQEKIAESSSATLVDQKKAIAEQTSLRKQKKAFGGFEDAQRGIDKTKAEIAELRKTMDNAEAKALNERYDKADKELKAIKAEQDEAYKSVNALRDERSKAHAEQQEKYSSLKEVRDKHYKAKQAYREYEQEQYRQRQERQKAEREAYNKEKRRKIADKKLEEASEPAYMDEILIAEGLIRYFDPSSPEASKSLRGPSGFAAEAQRSVDSNSEFKGMKVSKKEEREDTYFMGTGGKKGKKGKKGSAAGSPAPGTPTEGKFNISIGIIEELAKVGMEPPMSQAGVPAVVEKLKEKREKWKTEQDQKTKENIERARKEIDRLEAEAKESQPSTSNRRTHDSSKKPAAVNQAVNGTAHAGAELAQEKDADADVAEDMKKASIEEST